MSVVTEAGACQLQECMCTLKVYSTQTTQLPECVFLPYLRVLLLQARVVKRQQQPAVRQRQRPTDAANQQLELPLQLRGICQAPVQVGLHQHTQQPQQQGAGCHANH
jgi:hypothetical protein